MFRCMRRYKQGIPTKECIEILKTEKRGVLSIMGDDGYPYGVPLNHWYCEKDGKIYFHGSRQGKKIDSIKKCNKASYCVYDKGFCQPGEWALNIKSVIVFGKIEFVTDEKRSKEICVRLAKKFTDDEKYLERMLDNLLNRVCCMEFVPLHITGKFVKER